MVRRELLAVEGVTTEAYSTFSPAQVRTDMSVCDTGTIFVF